MVSTGKNSGLITKDYQLHWILDNEFSTLNLTGDANPAREA